jgi:cytochrome c-type biogenesis protein
MNNLMPSKVNTKLLIFASSLFVAIAAGLIWLFAYAPTEQTGLGWYLFSFATGLTMIVLPCTLPLAFVIVPLSMGKGVRKGLGIALSFGLGIATTLSLYGVAAAVVGKIGIGTLGTPLEVIKNWVYFIAGIFAYLFALGEVGLIKIRMPSYTGAAPAFIQKQGDFLKALLLGLFLGNIGVGCPHPATPLLLIEIASSGNIFYGWTLFLTHAIGRIVPLLLLAVLGISGVNGLSWLIARKEKIEKATGWAMVFVAGFIMTLGLFTHDWWVNSGIHTGLESLTQEETILNILGAKLGTGNAHHHGFEVGQGLFGLPLSLGNWWLVILWLIPIWWWWAREKRHAASIPETAVVPEKTAKTQVLRTKKWLFVSLSLLLALVFIYVLPTNFLYQSMNMEMMPHTHTAALHEEATVLNGLVVNLSLDPAQPTVSNPTKLMFFVNEKPAGTIVDDLVIEHEKYMHVIGVRDDLTNFVHVHPTKVSPGNWEVYGMFREPGIYKLWTDVNRAGETHSFGHTPFTVNDFNNVTGTHHVVQPVFNSLVAVGDYRVELTKDPVLSKNVPANIGFTIKDASGNEVPLDNFLGVKMHLAVIKDDLSVYIHTHPSDHVMDHMMIQNTSSPFSLLPLAYAHGDVPDGHMETPAVAPSQFKAQVPFSVTFPSTGTYKLFGQFRPAGLSLVDDQSLVAEFFVNVADSAPQTRGNTPRTLLFVVSIISMLILGVGVKKYLEH